LRLFSSF